jgi:hypothetical protein
MKNDTLKHPCAIFGLALLFCLLYNTAKADDVLRAEYSHRRYTTQDGLHHLLLQSLFQDKSGFLWMGSLSGFARFDGFTFTPFLAEKGENIFRIEDFGDGKIRAFGLKDCFVVDKNDSIQKIHLTDSMNLNSYNSSLLPNGLLVYESPDNRKYLMQLDGDTLTEYLRLPKFDKIRNNRLFLDTDNDLLYIPVHKDRCIWVYNTGNRKMQSIDIDVETFFMHSRLGLLAIGEKGIYKIKGCNAEMLAPYSFERLNKQILEMKNGDLLIRDFLSIYRMKDNQVEQIYYDPEIPLWDMILDRDENLYVASNKGLYNFFHLDFKNYSIPGHSVRTIVQDDEGKHWFAGINEDLFCLSEKTFSRIEFPLNWSLPTLSFIYGVSHNDRIYFSRDGGVLIKDKKRFTWANLPTDCYYSQMVPYEDDLYVVGIDRIYRMDKHGAIVNSLTSEQLMQDNLCGLVVDKKGRRIICGYGGLNVVDDDTIRLIESDNTAHTSVICVDKDGNVWSSSENRLNLLKNDSVITVQHFPNDYIIGLLAFGDSYLIVATLKGFYIADLKKYFAKGKLQTLFYNHNNGMTGLEPIYNSLYMDKNGIVWMPTSECVVTFDPQKLIHRVSPPNLVLLSCKSSTDNVNWENNEANGDYKFNYRHNNIRFSFIGLKFSDVENVRYSYRLKGFQEEWSHPSTLREAGFNNLPPGHYIFEIYTDAGTDESRSEIQTVHFTIHPAFWQTSWFLAVLILSLMLASAGIALFYQRRKNKVLFEHLETEKQLNELRIKSIRLKAIPHFNANVLAAIEYYIMNSSKSEALRLLGIYSRFTFQTLREVDRASRSLSEELEYVKMYLELEKLRFIDKFDYTIDVDPEVNTEVQLPNMILHTYSENAVKHGLSSKNSGGSLQIKVVQSGDIVCVSVEDNGVGREAATRNKNVPSSKQGLDILSRQIEIYNRFNPSKINQKIDDLYADGQPAGTRFTVEVPYGFVYQ